MGMIGGLIFGTLLGLTVGPKTPTLGEEGTGDPALVADVRAVLVNDRGYDTLSVGRVRGGQVAFAGLARRRRTAHPQPRTSWARSPRPSPGMLLADAVQRGEMAVEDQLSKYLTELAGSPAGTSACSSWPPTVPACRRSPHRLRTRQVRARQREPYDVSVAELIEATRPSS